MNEYFKTQGANHDNGSPLLLTFTRARATIGSEIKLTEGAIAELERFNQGLTNVLNTCALDALVCAEHGLDLPLNDDDARVEKLLQVPFAESVPLHIQAALDVLESHLTTLNVALDALSALAVIGHQLPASFANLPAIHLAQRLNSIGHSLLVRGRTLGR